MATLSTVHAQVSRNKTGNKSLAAFEARMVFPK